MKKLFVFILFPLTIFAQKQPKLIVGVVVDQMRYEMLDRFHDDFGPDGFNLLVDKGYLYDSCTFSYIPTFTAPGHATIYTGQPPTKHGIIANDIYMPINGSDRYCVVDDDAKPVGTDDQKCNRSPQNMRGYTIGDSLKMLDDKSRVIAVSLKDRGAILPGGKNADAAYWMDKYGMMVSSTYYMNQLPQWVDSFNTNGYIYNNILGTWDYFQDPSQYDESLPDDSPFEKKQFDDKNVLPYNISSAIRTKGLDVLRETPFGNSLVNQFAIWALREERLGRDKHTDLLAISYSATDYIGHAYGPQSVEVQDAYLRLDRDLAYLIHVLDTEIGRNNYVLFLTTDHGVANTPADERFSYENKKALKHALNAFTNTHFGASLVKHIASQQVWLDEQALIDGGFNRKEIIPALQDYMQNNGEFRFEKVYTKDEIAICKSGDCLPFRNSFIPHLSGDLYYIRPYGQIERKEGFGTTHGSGFLYDTHVPLLFFGGNVTVGRSTEKIHVHEIRRLLRQYVPEWNNAQ